MLIDCIPSAGPVPRGVRNRPAVYTDRLFLEALVIMIVKRLHRSHTLYTVLEGPTAQIQALRMALGEGGRYPSRRTSSDGRLGQLLETLPERIGVLGWHLVRLLRPWAKAGRAAALDPPAVFRTQGGV